MKILVVENNLAAFLTAVYHAYYGHKDAEKITSDAESVTMLDYGIRIETDTALAAKVREGIMKKAGKTAYKEIADAYLSGDSKIKSKSSLITLNCFCSRQKALTLFSPLNGDSLQGYVKQSAQGSSQNEGVYSFRPNGKTAYITLSSAPTTIFWNCCFPHFRIRFNDQKFVLHDLKRKKDGLL